MQEMVTHLPHAGMAATIDIGDAVDIHPKDKLDVGERLALWALKNDYGRATIVPSGPILKDVTVAGSKLICSFDHVGSGLMVGFKNSYPATQNLSLTGGTLQRFLVAGATEPWHTATATIVGDTVEVSSPSVSDPRKVVYAYWMNPELAVETPTQTKGLLYNKEGLPASPFYIADATAAGHFTVTASAGAGGTISPPGSTTCLRRRNPLYTITPDAGNYILDVTVDGVSVGSVKYYTFDPLYANHTIAATFARKAPSYTITASAHGGGSIEPSNAVSIPQGGAQTFTIVPQPGMFTKSLVIDGIEISARDSFSFSDVRSNHTLGASFTCMIKAESGYGGSISPCGDIMVDYSGNQTFKIAAIPGYAVASVMVDGKDVGARDSYTFGNVTSSHTFAVKFKGGSGAVGKIPSKDQLILACLAESLPSGNGGGWPTLVPEGGNLKPRSSSETVRIDGRNYSRNIYWDGDGFSFKYYSEPIPCKGASIVTLVRPMRMTEQTSSVPIVDVFYDRLMLGIRGDSGLVCVTRNGGTDNSKIAIPDRQITILSLIVQPDGKYKVYANGAEVISNPGLSDMTALVPPAANFAKGIVIGSNGPDAWTAFNGDIGDVFLYKTALSDDERKELEAYITHKL